MTLFVVMREGKIEDYYEVSTFSAVFDDHEKAENWIEAKILKFKIEAWRYRMENKYHSELRDLVYNDPLYIATNAELFAKRDDKPKYDQSLQRDKEYNNQHIIRKHKWNAEVRELEDARDDFFNHIPAKIEEYKKNLVNNDEEIVQVDSGPYGRMPVYTIKEIELNPQA